MTEPLTPKGPYKDGNTDDDGNYIVGKNRTPDHGKFRKGDGRKRGRRAKGTRNLDTDVMAEATAQITVNEGGKEIRISKQQAMIKRLIDLGFNGNVAALKEAISLIQACNGRAAEREDRGLPVDDLKIIEEYFQRKLAIDDRIVTDPDEGAVTPSSKEEGQHDER